jgi:hypothetical protein
MLVRRKKTWKWIRWIDVTPKGNLKTKPNLLKGISIPHHETGKVEKARKENTSKSSQIKEIPYL